MIRCLCLYNFHRPKIFEDLEDHATDNIFLYRGARTHARVHVHGQVENEVIPIDAPCDGVMSSMVPPM